MNKGFFGLVGVIFVVTFLGCAKDRTVDDWRREKVAQEMAKVQAISGSYRGILASNKDGAPLGAIDIEISPDTRVKDSQDQTTMEQQASVLGKVTFEGHHKASVLFKHAYYNSSSGEFKGTVSLVDQDVTAQLNLYGTINGEQFEGQIAAFGYPESGGHFVLTRNGPAVSASALLGGIGQAVVRESDVQKFGGVAVHSSGKKENLILVIFDPGVSSEEQFFDIFVPVKTAQVTLSFPEKGEGTELIFSDALLDERTGSLSAKILTVSGPDKIIAKLECTRLGRGWDCAYSSSKKPENVFKVELNPI